ncbi:MAG: hypothetical protein JO128_12650, partial [Alphaproteobacteria bacterium]|nr:hypothetical protein [Alphaproteobacteria bacterium]
MTKQKLNALGAAAGIAAAITVGMPASAASADCPNGGTVRFGVEPYDTAPRLIPVYNEIAKMIGEKIGCKV